MTGKNRQLVRDNWTEPRKKKRETNCGRSHDITVCKPRLHAATSPREATTVPISLNHAAMVVPLVLIQQSANAANYDKNATDFLITPPQRSPVSE